MRKLIILIGVVFAMSMAACGDPENGGEVTTALPEPDVRVVEQPTATTFATTDAEPIATMVATTEAGPTTTMVATTEAEPTPTEIIQEPENKMAFGMESHQANFQDHTALLGETGLTLMRSNGLLWHEVETIEGQRDWTTQEDLEGKLERAAASGLSTILLVRGTPQWAQLVPGSFCGPIKAEKLQDFADFMFEAVSRYSQPPYNVKYWELGNEPDVDPSLVRSKSVFGCWGNYQDPYYGGGYYAEMLKTVYPVIKIADPDARILLGGLLLDCDPNHPPEGKDCSPGNFLEGILLNGGGDYFDIISFHGYSPYFGPSWGFPYALYMNEHDINWGHLGGVVDGKITFIRQVLDKYQIEKPLYHTEGALMCAEYNPADCEQPGEAFYDAQADYAIRVFVSNWANGIEATIWYQFEGPGWRYSGLLDENQNPKPVYDALLFMSSVLSQTNYIGEITQYDGLKGYEFRSPEKRILVLWSHEQVDTPIQIPDGVQTIYDKFGNEINPSENELIVNSPMFFELLP